MTILGAAALVVCIGIAVYIFQNVPMDTRLPYSGRFGRNGIPMPVAITAIPLVLALMLRPGRSGRAHHMGRNKRIAYYLLQSAVFIATVWGQWVMAELLMVEAGLLPE